MRRIILASTLVLAGCATRPQPQEPVEQLPPPQPASPGSRQLLGLTTSEVLGYFGQPALQVREGTSLKLQFRGGVCVLDVYLYPSTGGQLRVTHFDSRLPSGADMDQAACVRSLEERS